MPNSNLPDVGVRAVVENYSPFNKAIDGVNKKIGDFVKSTEGAAKAASPLDKAFSKLGVSVDGLRDKFLRMGGVSPQVSAALVEISSSAGLVALGIAAAAAAIAGFVALGVRGAGFQDLAHGFDTITASVGILSTTMLRDLRRAAAGTISDFELIRLTNRALIGEFGTFGQQLGQSLPRLLEIARVQANATGQNVNDVFQSLLEGIKRAAPRMISQTGLIINATTAEQAYAESIGKTVQQLTDDEKQQAILQAVLTQGQQVMDAFGNSAEGADEKLARAGATLSNILDRLAVIVQPTFSAILDGVNNILTTISNVLETVGPYILAVFQMIGNALRPVINFIHSILAPIFDPIFNAIGNVLRIFQDPELARQAFFGAARMIGSFANGILDAANKYVFPAIIQIATFIADFLMGLSPPPEGPLSTIDKGGANLMLAWLEGITGVSLDPVKQVAAQVSAALGEIGRYSLEQVNARLAQLDAALLPFQQRLDIVKNQFDALREPAEAALRAVDRQLETAVKALAQGDAQAAASVRALDNQRAAIEAALDAQQNMADAAQLQFALAKAQQARERTLLEIRQKMLGVTQKTVEAVTGKKKAKAGAGEKPKAPKVGAGAPTPAPGGAGGFAPSEAAQSVLDLLGGQGAIDDAGKVLQEGFKAGLDPTVVGAIQDNVGDLQTQLGRIGSVDIGARISERVTGAFEGLRHFFQDEGEGTLSGYIDTAVQWFEDLPQRIVDALDSLWNDLNVSVFTPLANFFTGSGGLAGQGFSLQGMLNTAVGFFQALPQRIVDAVSSLWTTFTTSEAILALSNFFTLQTEDATTLYGILTMGVAWFAELPTRITDALGTLWEQIVVGPLDPFIRFFGSNEPYSLAWYIDQAVQFFADLPGRIVAALVGLGQSVWSSVALPVIGAFNALIAGVEGMLNNLKDTAANILDQFADIFNVVLAFTGAAAGFDAHALAAWLRMGRISITPISVTPPAFLTGGATGGLFSKGMMQVGERGTELISSASKLAVFPNQFVRALDGLTALLQTSILAQPAPMPIASNYNNQSYDSSMSVTMNGLQDSGQGLMRLKTLQAYRRRR